MTTTVGGSDDGGTDGSEPAGNEETEGDVVPIYGHRDDAGFAFVSYGKGYDYGDVTEEDGSLATERIEGTVFKKLGDDVFGPSPSQIERDEIADAVIPVEGERHRLWQVGTMEVTRTGTPSSITVFDRDDIETHPDPRQ